jgi:MerR family transcriptional regulator/heat shock protein HspR
MMTGAKKTYRKEETFTAGFVARKVGISPSTLRYYEREGFLEPLWTEKGIRRYTRDDIDKLLMLRRLREELGVNLAGAEIILEMRRKMEQMQEEMDRFVNELIREVRLHLKKMEAQIQKPLVPSETRPPIPIDDPESS